MFANLLVRAFMKGTMAQDGYFFESLNILLILSVYALMVFKIFQKLSLRYTIINFSFASVKLLTTFENAD
jgi:hypothetical protein